MIGGGQNQCDLYLVTVDTGAYKVLAGISGTTEAATRATDVALTLDELVDTKPAFQDDGTVKISFDNYKDDQDLLDFLDAVNPVSSSSAVSKPDVLFENGVKKTSAVSSTASLVLAICYGAKNADGDVKVLAALGNIARTSGSYNQKADGWSQPSFEYIGVKAEYDVAIDAALFDATLISATDVASALPEISQYAGYKVAFVAEPTA